MTKVSDTKAKILNAALDLFSEKGARATTTRMISNQAGVNEVTLFRHFKTKEELFNAVFEEVEKIGLCSDRVIREDLPPREAIEFLIRELLNILISSPKIIRMILYGHLDHVGQFEDAFQEDNNLKINSFLSEKLKVYLKGKPDKKNIKIKYLSLAIMSNVFGLAVGHTIFKTRLIEDDEFDAFVEQLLKTYLD
ncbi:MAG: TetR/AcrR family transcriptional regulator [Deltaproteobacteria bacterium]|nr:TetR/AcrR family transcriptional regulator [Deltaproteobacteria bacterium]MBT4526323.1 TetR/AcrR family transcriptional regulator [Deltaproteobacteria bacterium]